MLNRVDYRVNVNGYIHTYHDNILRLYVERKTEASHCLLSAEASIPLREEDDDESDEYSLEDCTFPSNKEIETYRDVSISEELTDKQRKVVKELLVKYPDVLTSIPGKTELLEHDIKLSTAEPVRSKGYPIRYKTREIMESEIDEMIELGVIEHSISPYSSPIVLVPKKMGRLDSVLTSASLIRLRNSKRNLCRIRRKLLIECQGIGSICKWIYVKVIGN